MTPHMSRADDSDTIHGGARFHFDPRHDPSEAPSLADVQTWIRRRLRDEDGSLAHAYRDMLRSETSRTLGARIANLRPAAAMRTRMRVEDDCAAIAMTEMVRVHQLMREFAVDLTDHPKTPIVEAVASTAIHGRHLARLREWLDQRVPTGDPHAEELRRIEEQVEAPSRIAGYHEHLRVGIADEALANLMKDVIDNPDPRRHYASFMAAREEVGTPETRERIDQVLESITRSLPRPGR